MNALSDFSYDDLEALASSNIRPVDLTVDEDAEHIVIRADKQFEMQLYPDDNHHLRKGNNAAHMHERVLRFLAKEFNR